MGLGDSRVGAAVAVSDMGRAREFYEGKLGLTVHQDQGDGGRTYTCGEGSTLHVYPSAHAGRSGATLAAWTVDDVGATVDELSANGVTFEQYGDPIGTNEKGIAVLGGQSIAWFKDPDGNILAIEDATASGGE
jgi:catechol 2,3-dioxygenase-like lactoylglutathione lyase family enzyme